MAKRQQTETISSDIKELNDLKVKRIIEETEIYNEKIKQLEINIDNFNFGIKRK